MFGSLACRGGPQQLLAGTSLDFANEQLGISKGCEGLARVHMLVMKLLQDRADNKVTRIEQQQCESQCGRSANTSHVKNEYPGKIRKAWLGYLQSVRIDRPKSGRPAKSPSEKV